MSSDPSHSAAKPAASSQRPADYLDVKERVVINHPGSLDDIIAELDLLVLGGRKTIGHAKALMERLDPRD